MQDLSLVMEILIGNIGPSTLVAVSGVSKTWLEAASHKLVVISACMYTGNGLTKQQLMRLLAVSAHEADALPRTTNTRRAGGIYYLYAEDAIQTLLNARGWRERLRDCAGSLPPLWRAPTSRRLPPWRAEERMRARMLQRLQES